MRRRGASGFCYINDIVLGILELLRTYPRVLYIDIDCHHGDGVEEASTLQTRYDLQFSQVHKDEGTREGEGVLVNVPLKDGITDEAFKSVFDPFLRKHDIPLILLGGGGYTVKNVDTIDPNLPWSQYFEWFGPRYRLEVLENNMEDLNIKDGLLDNIRVTALQLQELAAAPSVGMHDVPRESIGQHLGFRTDQVAAHDSLDIKLARHARYVYDLQETDTPSDTSDDEKSWDSDDSASQGSRPRGRYPKFAQPRQRMSIITGQHFDAPITNTASRRFFQSGARWDEGVDDVIARKYAASLIPPSGAWGADGERGPA
ncbi:hypothetical protein FPV67DRAFT_1445453 [Lyophyllum atratum]|nr:hypothetical protein FPV67DRAFT_1445453 [Lyophyllum atratum]